MSALTLVRHGQASFFAADYDVLSDLGKTQGRLLGEYWAGRCVQFEAVFTGPRLRQRHTAEQVRSAYRAAGLALPEPVVLDELDEYDLDGLRHGLAPTLARHDAAFAALFERYRASQDDGERERRFQKMFEALVGHWQAGSALLRELDVKLESWESFRTRVARGMRRVLETPGRGVQIAAFTSGGFIGTAVQTVLEAPDRAALELSWRLRNGALCEFVFTRDRLSLESFNTLPHLEDPALRTYR
jgi:broad specificity phosphatase PhoE